MNIILFEKYKSFKNGIIFFDVWMEYANQPFLENVKWAFYFKIIILNLAIIQVDIKKLKNKPV